MEPYRTCCFGMLQLIAIATASFSPDFCIQKYPPPKSSATKIKAIPRSRFNLQNSDYQTLLTAALQRNIVMLLPRILQLLVPQLP